jgi:hypothetical protein
MPGRFAGRLVCHSMPGKWRAGQRPARGPQWTIWPPFVQAVPKSAVQHSLIIFSGLQLMSALLNLCRARQSSHTAAGATDMPTRLPASPFTRRYQDHLDVALYIFLIVCIACAIFFEW